VSDAPAMRPALQLPPEVSLYRPGTPGVQALRAPTPVVCVPRGPRPRQQRRTGSTRLLHSTRRHVGRNDRRPGDRPER